MRHSRGSTTLSALGGLACVAAVGVAGWSYMSGVSICSLTGACSSGVQAKASGLTMAAAALTAEPVQAADTKAEQRGAEAQQCSKPDDAAAQSCSKPGAKVQTAVAANAALIEPGAKIHAAAKTAGVINATCPGSGEPVDPAVTATFAGFKVGFCCATCQEKFAAKSDEEKAKAVAVMLTARPVNSACPGSGMPVDASQTLTVAGNTVAFCCADCKKAFAAKPIEEQFAYIGQQVGAATINDTCARCNMPVTAEAGQAIFAGQRIGFGCASCRPAFEAMSQDEKVAFLGKILLARQAKLAEAHACTDASCTKDAPCAACKAKMEAEKQVGADAE